VGTLREVEARGLWPCTLSVTVDPSFDTDVTQHFDELALTDPGHCADKERPVLVEVVCNHLLP
jgi:hypothetical protein